VLRATPGHVKKHRSVFRLAVCFVPLLLLLLLQEAQSFLVGYSNYTPRRLHCSSTRGVSRHCMKQLDDDIKTTDTNSMQAADLVVGQQLQGTVVKSWGNGDFAVYVNIGADKLGLLKMSEFGEGFPMSDWPPKKGTEFPVRVHEMSDAGFWLTRKEGDLSRPPVPPKIPRGDVSSFVMPETADVWLDGVVTGMNVFGIFATVHPPNGGQPQNALLKKGEFNEGFAQQVSVGSKVRVRVKSVDVEKKRIVLTTIDP